jgi:hypothetical protein
MHNVLRLAAIGATALLAFLGAAAPASAQATRTWVSGVGDDANPCSRTAPCKTFAGAISKTAAGGEIDALDPGGFGALTITKSITLDGGGGQVASILVAGTNGIVVAAGAGDRVKIRNIRFQGVGVGLNGIRFISGAALILEHDAIYGFSQNGIDFEPSASNSMLYVLDTEVQYSGGAGIFVGAGNHPCTVTLEKVFSVNNGTGLQSNDGAKVLASNSEFTGNGTGVSGNSAGVFGSETNLDQSNVFGNTTGISATGGSGAIVRLSNVGVYDNSSSIVNNGIVASYGNNRLGTNAGNGTPGTLTTTIPQQ